MRKCIRCQSEMRENCSIKIEGGGGLGIVMAIDEKFIFPHKIGRPKVAICPRYGEVSIYVQNIEDLR